MKFTNSLLPADLREKVIEKLAINADPENTTAGLNAIYQAWVMKIPYDNLRKRIIKHHYPEETPAPISAERFFNDWLNDGIGGTCWEMQEALYCLLSDLHFSTRFVLASVHQGDFQRTPYNHGTLVVAAEDDSLLFDPSLMLGQPLPLRSHSVMHPTWRSEMQRADRGWCVRWQPLCHPPVECYLLQLNASHAEVRRQRLLATGSGDHPFNAASYLRLMRDDTILGLVQGEQVIRQADGDERRQPLSRQQQLRLLIDELGVSERLAVQIPPDRPKESHSGPRSATICSA